MMACKLTSSLARKYAKRNYSYDYKALWICYEAKLWK
jgi:hypothetical protein